MTLDVGAPLSPNKQTNKGLTCQGSVGQSVGRSVSQTVSQSVSQSVIGKSVSQRAVSQSANQITILDWYSITITNHSLALIK